MLFPSSGFLGILIVFSSRFSPSVGRLIDRHLHSFGIFFSKMHFSHSGMVLFASASARLCFCSTMPLLAYALLAIAPVRHCFWSPLPSAAAVLTSDLTCQALPLQMLL